MENLTKQLCHRCDGPLAVDEDGVTYCPPCKRKKQSDTERQWRNVIDGGEFLSDPSGFGDDSSDDPKE